MLIDNKVLKAVISELYYPISPYEFSVLSVEILGSAYEQFLGKQIKLNSRHKIEVDEKPEVRKAGGVYYTPQYIVDYIVKQTVGKLAEGKTPEQVRKLRIVDPACGSGSFLIGAYQYLLNWHHQYYKPKFTQLSEIAASTQHTLKERNDAIKERSKLPLTPDGALTTALKKSILLNNIYGVDIDTQAVEVTKLSLLLKCMEGETQSSMSAEMRFGERVLPTLDSNIKSGNSLIDLDFYDGQIDFEPAAEKKIKPFSWEQSFKEVFYGGGFDAVIGNPPYDVIEKERLGEVTPHAFLQKYIEINDFYRHALGGKLNIYRFFMVKFIKLTKIKGRYGLIIPSSILGDKSCVITRQYILNNSIQLEFDCFPQKDISSKRIFEDAKLSTTILYGEKNTDTKSSKKSFIIRTYPGNSFLDRFKKCLIKYDELKSVDAENTPIPMIDENNWKLLVKIHSETKNINLGAINNIFVVRRGEINQTVFRSFIKEDNTESYQKLIKGVQIGPYRFNKKLSQGKVEWFDEQLYLKNNGYKEIIDLERIATQRITGVDERLRLVATLIQPQAYFADSTNSIHCVDNSEYEIKYLLGLINSRFFQWRFKLTSTNNNVSTNEILAMPIRSINFKNSDRSVYNELIKLVGTMLILNKEKTETTSMEKVESLQQRIAYTDVRINKLVYELYELTEEEIKIIEEI